jgi:hypothetical protein
MPKKIQNTTKAALVSVPLPNHGASYTVISHQFVIDYAYQALAAAGFGIVDEEYRCTADGQIAQGIYRLNFNNDPELSMMFAWTNSYNKQVKFKCVVGAYINNSGSVMISGEVGSWVRKHTGTADTEVKDTIDQYITNAHMYYTQLCSDKAAMQTVTLNRRKQSQLLGVLFAEYEILTTEQASMIRDQMKRPQQVFANTDSLWAFYNYVTNSLQSSHPKTWMEDQRILHYFIGTICDFSTPVQAVSAPVTVVSAPVVDPLYADPGQTNILDQIAEVENLEQTGTKHDENEVILYQSEEVVQDGAICADDLHQSEESILDTNEAKEVSFDIDADDDAVLDSILTPCAAHDAETEREIQQENLEDIFPQTKITSLEPTPEEYELIEQEEILPWNDDIVPTDSTLEPAQSDSIELPQVSINDKDEEPVIANLNLIETEDPDSFDLDFGDATSTDNTDFEF